MNSDGQRVMVARFDQLTAPSECDVLPPVWAVAALGGAGGGVDRRNGAAVAVEHVRCAPKAAYRTRERGGWEVLMVRTGDWTFEVAGDGRDAPCRFRLGRWDMVFVPPGLTCTATNPDGEDAWLYSITPVAARDAAGEEGPDGSMADFERNYVVRFGELTPANPSPDMVLERFDRTQYILLGRPDDLGARDPAIAVNREHEISLGLNDGEPGKGFCSHKHELWEAFIALAGRWRVTLGDGSFVELDASDVGVVPGGIFHDARNVGTANGYLLSINPGGVTNPFALLPEVERELAAHGRASMARQR